MPQLGAIAYDPAAAANKVTTAKLAMTAIDTTNLRLAFTVPASGRVLVHLSGTVHGATTFPQIMLGVLEGSTVRARHAPLATVGGTALASTRMSLESWIPVTGLTPAASLTWDAAYAVELEVAATGLKYGGPNTNSADDAFGAFVFEVWDVTT